jgi:hypothetical protein
LIEATGSPIAPVFYVMFGAVVGLVEAFFLVDPTREDRLPVIETAGKHCMKLPTRLAEFGYGSS